MTETFDEYDPRNVNLEKSLRLKFDEVKDYKEGNWKVFKDLADVFLFAAILGFLNKKREPLKEKYPLINYKAGLTKEQKWLLKSMMIDATNSLDMLATQEGQKELLRIAEEYANGGIGILHHMVCLEKLGTFSKRLESALKERAEKHNLRGKVTSDSST